MNWLDITFLVILGVSVFLAFLKGFVKELISIVALYIAVVVAGRLYPTLNPMTSKLVSAPLDSVLSFLLIFFGILGLAAVVAFIVNRLVKSSKLKPMDRVLGVLFGLVRGWLICAVMILALTAFPWKPAFVAQSRLAPYLLLAGQGVVWVLPRNLRDAYNNRHEELHRFWVDQTNLPEKKL